MSAVDSDALVRDLLADVARLQIRDIKALTDPRQRAACKRQERIARRTLRACTRVLRGKE
jgi:hypothetical protein